MSRAGLSRRPVGSCTPLPALFFRVLRIRFGCILGGEGTEARHGGGIVDGMCEPETSFAASTTRSLAGCNAASGVANASATTRAAG